MLELCLFDLDNTLVHTDDLQWIRENSKQNFNPAHLAQLNAQIFQNPWRKIYYSESFLKELRRTFPDLKLGVFTRAPRSYTDAVLNWAYPNFTWDITIAYEDVFHTKPCGEGVRRAMHAVGVNKVERVVLIGDSDADVKSGYNAGCLVALDVRSWKRGRRRKTHWKAQDLVPDGIIERDQDMLEFIQDHRPFLPNLERMLAQGEPLRMARYIELNHWGIEDKTHYSISVAGRSISHHNSVEMRRAHHPLSKSIEDHKNSCVFPVQWVDSIRNFIALRLSPILAPKEVIVTVVPHRPERAPRLEQLLKQLELRLATYPLCAKVTCIPDLLAYTDGVRSQHHNFLKRRERFENVRDHLVVNLPKFVTAGRTYLVIDDVVTTGASLIYAQKRLQAAGARDVHLFGLGKNVGDLYAYL